jgi:hypothetical protein
MISGASPAYTGSEQTNRTARIAIHSFLKLMSMES